MTNSLLPCECVLLIAPIWAAEYLPEIIQPILIQQETIEIQNIETYDTELLEKWSNTDKINSQLVSIK